MPSIPPTRKKLLKRPHQDNIQWILTNHCEKSTQHVVKDSSHVFTVTTIGVAKSFMKLLYNDNNKQAKIAQIVKDIKHLYTTVSFSSRTFIDYIIQHSSNTSRLLQLYHDVSVQLDILALTTRSILAHIPDLDEPLCEVLELEDEIGEAYINALDEKTMTEFFIKDGKQLVNWSGSMKRENAKRLSCILKYYSNTMKKEQCLMQLLNLNTAPAENINKHYYRQLRITKDVLFMSRMPTKQLDALIAKTPVFQLISTWFFEFEQSPILRLSDFALNMYYLNAVSENKQNVPDISLLLYVYHTACKRLSLEGKDIVRISDIIETLNNAVIKSLEQDDSGGLGIILTFSQLAFEQMHGSVGYTYASWFETTFINSGTSILTKKTGIVFINILQQLIPYEPASVLQIHGKALYHCSTIPNTNVYITTVKKRLLELGVDTTFKNYPESMKRPIQSVLVVIEDEISDVIQQFSKKGVIPQSLLTSSVFKKLWFQSTFLPKLMSWNGKEIAARNELIEALKKDKKIPDAMYLDFVQKSKKKK